MIKFVRVKSIIQQKKNEAKLENTDKKFAQEAFLSMIL